MYSLLTLNRATSMKPVLRNQYQVALKAIILLYWPTGKLEVKTIYYIKGGKTFTMGTALNTLTNLKDQGIIPRVIQEIFKQVKEREKKSQFIIKASFLEIYNEHILDLLNDNTDKNNK